MKRLKDLIVPLPPFLEIERIVAKVDELIALCNELDRKIGKSHSESEKLMESVVHHLLDLNGSSQSH
jgi:type I restriction enzyme S subunit